MVWSRRLVADGGVEPLAIVEDFDVFEDGGASRLGSRHRRAVDKFLLQGGEEALGDSVVPALAWAAKRLPDAVAGEGRAECFGGVLAATVGVEDETRCRLSLDDCHPERLEDEGCPHVVGDGKANDPPARQVDDDGEVRPALPGADVGDITHPRLVTPELLRVEAALQEVCPG
jgi:hypothetical protein